MTTMDRWMGSCEIVPPATVDANGPALIDVVGKPADLASRLLHGTRFLVVVQNALGDSVVASPHRLATSQRPAGGTKLFAGRTVTITVGNQ